MKNEIYLDILEQGLDEKIKLLDSLLEKNEAQRALLNNERVLPEELERNYKDKERDIEELVTIDQGFQEVYNRVREVLQKDKIKYEDRIRRMQQKIARVTEKSSKVKFQELENKKLMEQKFYKVKQQVREVKTSSKAASEYYKAMMSSDVMESNYMDSKY